MKSLKARLDKLENKSAGNDQIYVYFSDPVKGYADTPQGQYYPTFEALATAQGWETKDSDTTIKVKIEE